jgi:hypothetical protein
MRNPLLLVTLACLALAGCGGGSSSAGGGGTQSISVAFSGTLPTSLNVGATANLSAAVANDASAKGVNWSCAPSLACGSFNPPSTTSGGMTTYTAPTTVPAGGSVTITAISVSDGTKSTSQSVTIAGAQISITTQAPATMPVGATAPVAATTVNDPANPSVNWSCTPSLLCGTFSPSSSGSGVAATYTAPATVPAGGTVTIIASSVTDPSKTASETVTISALAISISLTAPPPGAMQTGTTAVIGATTVNDPANLSVNWSCTPLGTCGSFSPASTASGATTTYTDPAATPTGGTVTITATSATDGSKVASAVVMVSKPATNALLQGQYAFSVKGPTSDRGATTFTGSVTLDGNGEVTGGIEDVVAPKYFDLADPILATVPASIPSTSYYAVDANGHGILRMYTQNNEALDLSFVLTSASHAEVIEADGDPGSGTLDLQTPAGAGFAASQISGAYAFTVGGVDFKNPPTATIAIGGTFVADGASNIISGTIDLNSNGTFATEPFTGVVATAPDGNGRGQLRFVPIHQSTRTFTYYIVNSKVLRLFEDDGVDLTGGSAYAQGTASATLSGKYVYRHGGWNAAQTVRTVAAGQFAASASAITGVSDANASGTPAVPSVGKAVSGTYSLTANGDATVSGTAAVTDAAGSSTFNVYMVDPTLNILDPNNADGTGGALLLHTDGNLTGTGLVLPQSVGTVPTFTGNYAVNLVNSIPGTNEDELDLVGVMLSDGFGNFVNGLADYDENESFNPGPVLGAGVTGTFASDATNAGHFTAGLSVTPAAGGYVFLPGVAAPNAFAVSIYQAGVKQGLVIETDTQGSVEGTLVQMRLP